MSENRKKKRIARIGNIASVQGTAQVHNDDGLAQADCNLVYNIMQSMNKSQVMSYQQLQEFKSKESCSSRVNYSEQVCKQNGKTAISKQMKLQEKSFPLMAKCQKSMTFLQKNRCIPKPRAHVGFIPRPPQKPISDLKLNDRYHSVPTNKRIHNESAMKLKQNSKKSRCSPETSKKAKKPKISQSAENSCDKNMYPTETSMSKSKNAKLISTDEADSDNEFEQFLMEHQPVKCVESCSDSSDSSSDSKKVKRSNKSRRKKVKQTVYLAKMKKGKMTRKTLTESEESAESQNECIENNFIGEDNINKETCNPQIPSKKFQRIVEYDNSDDNISDSNLNDTGTCDFYDSSDNDSEHLDIQYKSSHVSSSATALSELNETSCCNILKLKCKIPCSVVIKRDPLLELKAAALHADNSSVIEIVADSNFCDDDDDCVIITEAATNVSDDSEDKGQPIANKNSHQQIATGIKKSLSVSEIVTDINVKNKSTHNGKMVLNANGYSPETETNALLSNRKFPEITNCDEDMASELQKDKVAISSKFLPDIRDAEEKEAAIISNKTEYPHINVNMHEYDEKEILETAAENGAFNVQILSVKSLHETDVIVLSDDSDENEMETKPIINETNDTSAGDSDVEIICLDLNDINNEKSINENIGEISNHGMNNRLNSDSNEEDCILLDSTEISNENNCTTKCISKTQKSSIVNMSVDIINHEKKNYITEKAVTDNASDMDKNSILKILNTIDFNCIKKVLNETTVSNTQIEKNSDSVQTKEKNPLCETIGTSNRTDYSFSAKQNPKDACNVDKVLINASFLCDDSSSINKTSSLKAPPVDTCEEHVLPYQKDVSGSAPNLVNLDNKLTSDKWVKGPTYCNSNTNITVLKSFVSEKEIATSPKTELNTLLLPQKNQQLLPRYSKIDSNESASDALDVLSVKSIQKLEKKRKKTILPLVELYQEEYKKFMEIKSTEKNVTAGLKLLEENQARKLMQISSSIKNIAENEKCFLEVESQFEDKKGEDKSIIKSLSVKTDISLNEIKKHGECVPEPSSSTWSDIKKDNKVKIFNDAVIEGASEILNLQAVGPTSSQKVYNHLINSVCAECGKHAMAACLGCAKVFYCSEKCGMSYWDKGHNATCKR